MIHALRCFFAIVWLRWRFLKNSVSGAGKRDTLEQMSRGLALVMPLLIVALSVGTFLAVSIVGYIGGRLMADGSLESPSGLLVVRLLLGIMLFAILTLAVVSPTQSTLSRYTRLLLLPISRRVLHIVEVGASLADPWVAIVAAGLTTFAIGIYAGGRPDVAVAALVLAAMTVAVVVCAGALASFLVAWLMRDRRRGELFTLIFVLAFSLLSFIPAFMSRSLDESKQEMEEGVLVRTEIDVDEFDRNLPVWTRVLPSEVHGRTMAAALAGDRLGVAMGMVTLGFEAILLFWASARVHRRMLGSLEGDQSRRRSTVLKLPGKTWPFLTPGASAVAWALMRSGFRTVRGRLTILLPGPMLAMLTAVFQGIPRETWAASASQYGYLLFGASIIFTFYSMQAISMNFFGSDRAGLTLQLLSPITDRDLAWGKIAGFASVLGAGVAISLLSAVVVAHTGPPAYWITVFLGAVATFFLISPLAIWSSSLFPVASDLSKTGSGGNPHALPMIVGTLCTVLLAAPVLGILAAAHYWFKSPIAAVPMSILWTIIAAAIGLPLVNVASKTIEVRRENLALVAQGR